MPLAAGYRLGPYEILALIGAGGMGEVYRARDTRLDRIVAVKVCKEKFSERFEREAQAIAALNHAHICQLYDVGPNYLVMEYIEGSALKGPLPLNRALEYAAQICDGLDAAHSKGITHRDLKPANILVTKSAGVKLLDFGLAKQSRDRKGAEADETLTMALTGEGQIVGTLYYMSPEQLQGQDPGPASDIFSFGLVLYEMLTGKRAFEGKNSASVIAAILERPAPSVANVAPPALDRAMQRCLEKDPEHRWHSAWDLRVTLDDIAGDSSLTVEAQKRSWIGPAVAWAAAALLALGLGIPAYRHATEEAPRMLKMSVLLPEKATPSITDVPAVSPDGKSIAFGASVEGKYQIWVRDLNSLTARPLPGTEAGNLPFWSPDGRWIGFFAGGKIKKMEVAGGPALTVCGTSNFGGGSWGKDYIIFGTASGVMRSSPAGDEPKAVTTGAQGGAAPWFLPDGRHFLYTVPGTDARQPAIYAADVESKDPTKNRGRVLDGAGPAAYSQGYLLFMRDSTLMAQPFDTASLETRGDAAPVAEQVGSLSSVLGFYGVSQNGVLAYTSGAVGNAQLTWYDHSGKPVGTAGTPGQIPSSAISSDGSTVASDRIDRNGTVDVWLLDLARGSESRFTFGPTFNMYPVWSPDGKNIAFYSVREGTTSIYAKSRDGVGQEQALDKTPGARLPLDWSRDGRYIVELVNDSKTKEDIWVLPLFGDRTSFVYLNSEFNERAAKLSPNGQWLAYVSDETGRNEIYLQPFPKPGEKIPVSTNGGDLPLWSRDGKELYYVGADRKLMAVEIKMSGDSIQAGTAKALFPMPGAGAGIGFAYDVGKDGRFLIPTPVQQSSNVPFTVVVNWAAGLKK
jgi:eukaryotic-like serine/threonine-protein kinase